MAFTPKKIYSSNTPGQAPSSGTELAKNFNDNFDAVKSDLDEKDKKIVQLEQYSINCTEALLLTEDVKKTPTILPAKAINYKTGVITEHANYNLVVANIANYTTAKVQLYESQTFGVVIKDINGDILKSVKGTGKGDDYTLDIPSKSATIYISTYSDAFAASAGAKKYKGYIELDSRNSDYAIRTSGNITKSFDKSDIEASAVDIDNERRPYRKIEGCGVNFNDGTIEPHSSYNVYFFACKKSQTASIQMYASSTKGIAFFDANDTYISGINSTTSGIYIDIMMPEKAYYFCISTYTDVYAATAGVPKFDEQASIEGSAFKILKNEINNSFACTPKNVYTNVFFKEKCSLDLKMPDFPPYNGVPVPSKGQSVSDYIYIGHIRIGELLKIYGMKDGWDRPVYFYDKDKKPILLKEGYYSVNGFGNAIKRLTIECVYARFTIQSAKPTDTTRPEDITSICYNELYVNNLYLSDSSNGNANKCYVDDIVKSRLISSPIIHIEDSEIATQPYYSKVKDYYNRYDALLCTGIYNITKEIVDADVNGFEFRAYRFKRQMTSNFSPLKKIIIQAGIHGSEIMGVQTVVNFAEKLATSSGNLYNFIRSNYEIIIIPIANPWGVENATRNNINGVNLNRNFPFKWKVSGYSQGDLDYEGVSAASEKETKAIMSVVNANRDAVLFFDTHAFGSVYSYDFCVWWATYHNRAVDEIIKSLTYQLDTVIRSRYTDYENASKILSDAHLSIDNYDGICEDWVNNEIGSTCIAATVELSTHIGSDETTKGNIVVTNADYTAFINVLYNLLLNESICNDL